MKLHLLLAFLLALPISWLQAQKADRLFEKMAYYEAIEKFLERPVQDLATMERLAHAYRLNHDTRNAEIWYARIVEQTDDPLNYLYYAQMLACNGNHAAARQWLERYASETGHRGPLPMPLEMDAGVESVLVRPASALNSPWSEYAPAWFSDGLVFASTRPSAGVERLLVPHADGWTGDDFSKLLFSKINPDGSLAEPRPFESHFDTRLHEGPACFFNNDSVALALITANAPARRGGKSRLSILLSELKGAHWSTPKALDLGAQDCNDAHPSLSADGRILIFASDRPGGYGGMDLYGCVWREDRYCLPINLGPQINSAGNEVFPFLHPDGTLYFASDGRGGLGGLDVFFARSAGELEFEQAVNCGSPINSTRDDFGLILDLPGVHGFFSSAREGGQGKDDLYEVFLTDPLALQRLALPPLVFEVIDEITGQPLEGARILALRQTAEQRYEGATPTAMIIATGEPDSSMEVSEIPLDPIDGALVLPTTGSSNADGRVELRLQPETYLVFASKEGYLPAQLRCNPNSETGCTLKLRPRQCISWQGQVVDRATGKPVPGARMLLVNLCSRQIHEVQANEEGFYTFPCLSPGCDYVLQGASAQYRQANQLITAEMLAEQANRTVDPESMAMMPVAPPGEGNPETLEGKGAGIEETELTTPKPDAESLLSRGLDFELKNIYYAIDRYEITDSVSLAELDRLAAFLLRNPDLDIEIRSHTDSRGDATYNLMLSYKRATTAREKLIERGVPADRIIAIGLGEFEPVSPCGTDTPCTEAIHRLNRRTEFVLRRRN